MSCDVGAGSTEQARPCHAAARWRSAVSVRAGAINLSVMERVHPNIRSFAGAKLLCRSLASAPVSPHRQ